VARLLVAVSLAVAALCAVTGVVPAYAEKLPTVTSVTPSSGPGTGGTLVTIEGTFLKNVRTVKFGSTNAASFTVHSQTSITATSPAHAVSTVDVTVTIPGGRSSPASPADHFDFTPTVSGVSPNTGPPAGGTEVTITGSGFIVGASATHFAFGETEELGVNEAVGVNCTTTTECTATTPELSQQAAQEFGSVVNVTATVNSVVSPQTPADQFHYHGLYVLGEGARVGVGFTVKLRGFIGARETVEQVDICEAFLEGNMASNGETTDVIEIQPAFFTGCLHQARFFGELPFSFALRLGDDGSATIEGPLGDRTESGCVYESNRIAGTFENMLHAPLNAVLFGTFPLVAEEKPGAECAATQPVQIQVAAERSSPSIEPIG
jgi:hypothetical protein